MLLSGKDVRPQFPLPNPPTGNAVVYVFLVLQAEEIVNE